jgi:hypothetical protein
MLKLKKRLAMMNGDQVATLYAKAVLLGYCALIAAEPALAQGTLRTSGETIFNTIYGLVGVIGGISVLLSGINWKMGGIIGSEPKKYFFNSLIGTGIGFGSVGIIQAIKAMVSGSGGISGV